MRELHILATTYHVPPSSYYGLTGLAARLFDRAILWANQQKSMQEPDKAPQGMEV